MMQNPTMPHRVFILCAWLCVIALAAYLRLNDLADRPMHADEATGARITANRMEANNYAFNPKHFHGPILSIVAEPIAKLGGEESWQSLSKKTLRTGPVIAGLLVVLTPLFWTRCIGPWGTLAAGSFMATSPLLVYYSRMFIHESLLLLFAMLTLPVVYRLASKPTLMVAAIGGLGAGLMYATKETFAVSMLTWAAACLTLFLSNRGEEDVARGLGTYILPATLFIGTTLVTAVLFYSNGFRSMDGAMNAFKTFFVYETTPGHDKAFSYYLQLLVMPKHQAGIIWTEGIVPVLAVASLAIACLQKAKRSVILFLGVATVGHFLIYSLISYKTPWLMLVPWAHLCLLCGFVVEAALRSKPALRVACILLIILGAGYQTKQSLHATGRFSSDIRNPYAYVPTSKDTEALADWLDELTAHNESIGGEPIAVIGSGYWPLPWYLKNLDSIGYWSKYDPAIETLSIVFAMPEQNPEVARRLETSHTALPRSLRAEVPITLHLRNDIWNAWIHPAAND